MKKQPATFNPVTQLSDRDTLLITLFIAGVVHIIAILGINFTTPTPPKAVRSIDVTLVSTPAKKPPKDADFLAQQDQLGAGEIKQKPKPSMRQSSQQEHGESKQPKKVAPVESTPKTVRKTITQPKAEQRLAIKIDKAPVDHDTEQHQQLSPEALRQQIAQLGTEIGFGKQGSNNNNIKFVNMVSAHKYVAAQYLKDWESKVERTGNLNYPEIAAKKNFSSTLTMDVGLRPDGSIYNINISKSSGNQGLDEAAKRIVRMSAPFAPLPIDLLKELKLNQQDVMVITRVWKFSDESGMVAH